MESFSRKGLKRTNIVLKFVQLWAIAVFLDVVHTRINNNEDLRLRSVRQDAIDILRLLAQKDSYLVLA